MIGFSCGIAYLAIPQIRDAQPPQSLTGLMSSLVSVAGILAGFLAAAWAILLSLDERPLIKRLKSTGYFSLIVAYVRKAAQWSLLWAVICAAWVLVDLGSTATWGLFHKAGFAAWLSVGVVCGLSYWRAIRVLNEILKSLG